MDVDYEDNYWAEDAIFMERNSRDFVSRNQRINENAAAISQILRRSSHGEPPPHTVSNEAKRAEVKHVYYPLHSPSQSHFDAYRTPSGGYGGLLSLTFKSPKDAVCFFDILETAKGPSLGTNFTLRYETSLA